ncbi:MAG: nuclear transport factor 2 family protein [Gammaproteobacteria bacterium]
MSGQLPEDTVASFLDAIEARDFDLARGYLSDSQFSYRSPVSRTDNADTFIALVSRIGPILERIERRRTFVDGGDVCSILQYRTTMDAIKNVPVVQLATVIAGKIVALEVFFDASEYNRMLDG